MTASEFGAALRLRRRELSISQEELASFIGVNRRVVGELERGKPTVQLEIALNAAQMVGLDLQLRART